MAPEGYVKKAIEIASAAGLLVEVIEEALFSVDEFTTSFEALNSALAYHKLQTIPEIKVPKTHKISIPRESNWEEPFRVEYDGKYLSLFGGDSDCPVANYGQPGPVEYYEMVLVPVVQEIRNIIPKYAVCDKDCVEIVYEMKGEDQ